jgi:4-amino-4-deoxy-L-arabinose transferase-like glycosyltransferase
MPTGYALALLTGAFFLRWSGAWSAGFSGADEPAHFLNSWFVSLYAREALDQNPMAFATEFYLHYPKISIGHWPPAYYGLASPIYWLLPPAPQSALALNLFVAALPAAGIAWLLARAEGKAAAILGAGLWALTPLALEGQAFLMLDQPLAACALAATIVWLLYAERPTWPLILLFAALAATAILIKGNGWLVGLVPPLHIAFTGRWRLLRSARPWIGAAAALAVVLPWYRLTAGIAADGFNYRPGLAYAAEALAANGWALAANVTPLGLALAGFALWSGYRRRREAPSTWSLLAVCLALIAATLALQSAVPADLDPRYAAPALPPLVVLGVIGAAQLIRDIAGRRRRAAAATLVALLLAGPGLAHIALREPKADLRLVEAAALARPGESWLIDGGSGAEGAYIAALAVRDPELRGYAVRASKLLSESDFMGNSYRLKFADSRAVKRELAGLGLAGVVLVDRDGMTPFAHSAQLRQALAGPDSPYVIAARLPHHGRGGITLVYRARAARPADVAAIRALGVPDKARALTAGGD